MGKGEKNSRTRVSPHRGKLKQPEPLGKASPHTLAEWLPPNLQVSHPLCGERLSSPSPHSAAGQVQQGEVVVA